MAPVLALAAALVAVSGMANAFEPNLKFNLTMDDMDGAVNFLSDTSIPGKADIDGTDVTGLMSDLGFDAPWKTTYNYLHKWGNDQLLTTHYRNSTGGFWFDFVGTGFAVKGNFIGGSNKLGPSAAVMLSIDRSWGADSLSTEPGLLVHKYNLKYGLHTVMVTGACIDACQWNVEDLFIETGRSCIRCPGRALGSF